MSKNDNNPYQTTSYFNLFSILTGFSFTMGIQMITTGGKSLLTSLSVIALFASGCMYLAVSYFHFNETPIISKFGKLRRKEAVMKQFFAKVNKYRDRISLLGTAATLFLAIGISFASFSYSVLVGIVITIVIVMITIFLFVNMINNKDILPLYYQSSELYYPDDAEQEKK